jgi:hypothetical protein
MRCRSRVKMFTATTLILTAIGSTRLLAADGYELTVIPPAMGAGIAVFRLNVTTGQVSNVTGAPASDVTDPQAIPPGEYHLYFAETPDNKTFWLYRLETHTGRTWFDGNNSWTEIK